MSDTYSGIRASSQPRLSGQKNTVKSVHSKVLILHFWCKEQSRRVRHNHDLTGTTYRLHIHANTLNKNVHLCTNSNAVSVIPVIWKLNN